jgi:hypothetical protein
MTRWFTRMAAVVVAGLAATTTTKAEIALALSEDGGPAFTIVASSLTDFSALSFTGPFGDFNVQIQGGSSTNAANQSTLLGSANRVTNSNLVSPGTHTLHLWVTQTNYTLPPGTPLSVESGMGGSINTPTLTLTNMFQAYADHNNNLFGITDFTNGPQTGLSGGTTFDTGGVTGAFSRDGTPYSVTSIANIQLTAGGQANYSDHVNLNPPAVVPAPPALFLVGAAVPVLALRRWNAKRKAVAAA